MLNEFLESGGAVEDPQEDCDDDEEEPAAVRRKAPAITGKRKQPASGVESASRKAGKKAAVPNKAALTGTAHPCAPGLVWSCFPPKHTHPQ